jgi:hypothetical protein
VYVNFVRCEAVFGVHTINRCSFGMIVEGLTSGPQQTPKENL